MLFFEKFCLKTLVHLDPVTGVVTICHNAKDGTCMWNCARYYSKNKQKMKRTAGKMAYAGHLMRDFILPSNFSFLFFFFSYLSIAGKMSAKDRIKWKKAVTQHSGTGRTRGAAYGKTHDQKFMVWWSFANLCRYSQEISDEKEWAKGIQWHES